MKKRYTVSLIVFPDDKNGKHTVKKSKKTSTAREQTKYSYCVKISKTPIKIKAK